MAMPREDKIETVSAASTNSRIDPTVRAILNGMQIFTQQVDILRLRFDETQSAEKKLSAEIALIRKNLARIQMGNVSEASSLITQTPPQPSEKRTFPERFTQPGLKAKDALRCIPILNGEDDIGVEEFIKEIKEMRVMYSE